MYASSGRFTAGSLQSREGGFRSRVFARFICQDNKSMCQNHEINQGGQIDPITNSPHNGIMSYTAMPCNETVPNVTGSKYPTTRVCGEMLGHKLGFFTRVLNWSVRTGPLLAGDALLTISQCSRQSTTTDLIICIPANNYSGPNSPPHKEKCSVF